MLRRFRRTCPLCGRPHLKNLSTHLYQVQGSFFKERKPYLKQARVSSWRPCTDLPRPFEGKQETKKLKMATTLGAEKKGSDLTKQEEKNDKRSRTHPVNTRQKRRKSMFKYSLYNYLISV